MVFWRWWQRTGYRRLASKEDQDASYVDSAAGPSCGRYQIPRRFARLIIFAVGLLAVVGLSIGAYIHFNRIPTIPWHTTVETDYPEALQDDIAAGSNKFVIILPANNPGPELCKLVTSGIGLGYPSPVLVNWKGNDTDDGPAETIRESQLAKITATLEYLDASARRDADKSTKLEDDDVVIVLDAYDVWFQLPPEVLLRRFHKANIKANHRLREQWAKDAEHMPMQQTIVISAQKECWPAKAGFNLHCDDIPESTLPVDLYGDKTDHDDNSHHWVRPKYLNSGSIMGPVGDMRRFYRRVQQRMDRATAEGWLTTGGDQGVFGEVFGEQEIWRRMRRQQRNGTEGVLSQTEGAGLIQENFEYHVGLDYVQELFVPTVYTNMDADFIQLNDMAAVEKESKDRGINTRIQGVPGDLAGVKNPLEDAVPELSKDQLAWGEMKLYADFVTTAVSPVIHHNAHRHGTKARRVWWWDRTWYFPYLRELVLANLHPSSSKPLAEVPARDGHLAYWSTSPSDSTPRWFRASTYAKSGLERATMDEVCRYPEETAGSDKHWWEEVFRDGKGPI